MSIDNHSPDPSMASATDRGLAHRHTSRLAHPHEAVIVYAVSKVSIDLGGRVSEVLWGQVDTTRNDWSTAEAISPVRDVVAAIHDGAVVFALFPSALGHVPERRFDAIEHDDGAETIALEVDLSSRRSVRDMDRIAANAVAG